jgi:hypothetical protein
MPTTQKQFAVLDRLASSYAVVRRYADQTPLFEVAWSRATHETGLLNEDDLHNKLKDPPTLLRLGIIGRVKAGKSSLLNGLLFDGQEVLPKAATPMTAALTILTYGDDFLAEVEFYDANEIDKIERLHAQYEAEFAQKLSDLQKQQANAINQRKPQHPFHRAGRNANELHRAKSPEELKRQVKKKMAEDVHLSGAHSLFEDMRNAGLKDPPQGKKVLTAKNLNELQNTLLDYVGASGRYTPWTQSLTIRLPYDSLRNLEIVDTPGVNDPVASREVRTQKELQNCAAVFVVSPAAQFLSQDDFELLDRLGSKAIAEVYLVASQVDTQLGSTADGPLAMRSHLDALDALKATLIGHAKGVINQKVHGQNQGWTVDHVLSTLHENLAHRLLFSSGHAAAMVSLPPEQWDEEHRHTFNRLKNLFPDDFSNMRQSESLKTLAGIETLQECLNDVRDRRQIVLGKQIAEFADAQSRALDQALHQFTESIQQKREEIRVGDMAEMESQLAELQTTRKAAIKTINTAFTEEIDTFAKETGEALQSIVERFFDQRQTKAALTRREELETYDSDKDGFLAGLARFFHLGGTEKVSRDVIVIQGSQLREALEGVRRELSNKTGKYLRENRDKVKINLLREMTAAARASMGDDNVDADRLSEAVRTVIGRLPDPPDFEFPELPDDLKLSGELRDSTAENSLSAAKKYLDNLEIIAGKDIRKIEKGIAKMAQGTERPAASILDSYTEEIQKKKEELKDRQGTLKRYDQMLKDIHVI